MDYIDGFIDAFPPAFDEEESRAEQAVTRQEALDILYFVCHGDDVSEEGTRALCRLANIPYETFASYSGKSAAL